MADKKENSIEAVETIEKDKQPDPPSLETQEELLEHDLEEVAGALCLPASHCVTSIIIL